MRHTPHHSNGAVDTEKSQGICIARQRTIINAYSSYNPTNYTSTIVVQSRHFRYKMSVVFVALPFQWVSETDYFVTFVYFFYIFSFPIT